MSLYSEERQVESTFTASTRYQKTLAKNISIKGVGLFSGTPVKMTFKPSLPNIGIVFRRVDRNNLCVKAHIKNLKGTPRCTIIEDDGLTIQCVEHVLSALYAHQIDNLIIELDSHEPPIMDGSSLEFVNMIKNAGIHVQDQKVNDYYLNHSIFIEKGDVSIIAVPSEIFKVSYTLCYEGHPMLDSQFYSFHLTKDSYVEDISRSRTFVTLDEVNTLISNCIINSVNLDHGVVIDQNKVLNQSGVRYNNEMVRHKILDFIGDLSLVGRHVVAHYIIIKSGHNMNTCFAKQIYDKIEEIEKL